MTCRLAEFVESNGPEIVVKGRTFCVSGILDDGDIAMARFATARAIYHGIRCNNTRVAGHPDAEVWSIIGAPGKPREIASFAVADGAIRTLAG